MLAALMNYITSDYAISIFPRGTFLNRRSFVACQERFPGTDDELTEADVWLRAYSSGIGKFDIVGADDVVYHDAENGLRSIGDNRCWTVPCALNS